MYIMMYDDLTLHTWGVVVIVRLLGVMNVGQTSSGRRARSARPLQRNAASEASSVSIKIWGV